MNSPVTLTLSRDEALVFFEWIQRINCGQEHPFEDQAEQRVLWTLEALLESTLEELFEPEYEKILSAARARVRDRTE